MMVLARIGRGGGAITQVMKERSLRLLSFVSFDLCGTAYFLAIFFSGRPAQHIQALDVTQAEPLQGSASAIKLSLPGVPNDSLFPANSPVQLIEDGKALGPAHIPAGFIANAGRGTFIAEKYSLPVMNQILVLGTFRPSDTYDNCRFNEIGANRMAEFVFRFLTENRLTPDAVLPH